MGAALGGLRKPIYVGFYGRLFGGLLHPPYGRLR